MDFSKTATARERRISDAGHGVADGDTRQTATAKERRTTDAGYGIGNGDTILVTELGMVMLVRLLQPSNA